MATITKDQRAVNILQEAINLGYELLTQHNKQVLSLEDVILDAEDFILANAENLTEEYVEVDPHTQAYDWTDRMGFHFECVGESFNWADFEDEETILLKKVVNSQGKVIQLYTIK